MNQLLLAHQQNSHALVVGVSSQLNGEVELVDEDLVPEEVGLSRTELSLVRDRFLRARNESATSSPSLTSKRERTLHHSRNVLSLRIAAFAVDSSKLASSIE